MLYLHFGSIVILCVSQHSSVISKYLKQSPHNEEKLYYVAQFQRCEFMVPLPECFETQVTL